MPASVFSVETMVTVTNIAWSTTAWDFGGTVAGDNSTADYPFLRGSEGFWPGRQALAFADFQTRLVADSGETLAMDGERITMRLDATLALRLDTNGLAANDPGDADSTPTPSCGKDGEGVRAETNYNNVTIWLQATGGGTLALSPSSNCVVEFTYPLAGEIPAARFRCCLASHRRNRRCRARTPFWRRRFRRGCRQECLRRLTPWAKPPC